MKVPTRLRLPTVLSLWLATAVWGQPATFMEAMETPEYWLRHSLALGRVSSVERRADGLVLKLDDCRVVAGKTFSADGARMQLQLHLKTAGPATAVALQTNRSALFCLVGRAGGWDLAEGPISFLPNGVPIMSLDGQDARKLAGELEHIIWVLANTARSTQASNLINFLPNCGSPLSKAYGYRVLSHVAIEDETQRNAVVSYLCLARDTGPESIALRLAADRALAFASPREYEWSLVRLQFLGEALRAGQSLDRRTAKTMFDHAKLALLDAMHAEQNRAKRKTLESCMEHVIKLEPAFAR